MNRNITVRRNPHFLADGLPLKFGSASDAQVLYDATNDEWTVQTKDSGGAQTDRLKIDANADITRAELYNDDPGADGIRLDTFHESASPAVSDVLRHDRVYGMDGAASSAKAQFGGLKWTITNIGDGTEEGQLDVELMKAGSLTSLLQYKTGAFAFQEATTISTSTGDLTLTPNGDVQIGSDTFIADGQGLVIGHSAKLTDVATNAAEFQILGTGESDSSTLWGRYDNTAAGAELLFVKGRGGTIGDSTTLQTGDTIALIRFYGEDGTTVPSELARLQVKAEGTVSNQDIPGAVILMTKPDGAGLSEALRVNSSQQVVIGDGTVTSHGNMGNGLIIDQLGNDNLILALKSSTDVATGLTTGTIGEDVETDDLFSIAKLSTDGGVQFQTIRESAGAHGLLFYSYTGSPETTDTSSTIGAMGFYTARHDGSNGLVDMTANSVAISWGEIDSGGSRQTRMLLKADDGELHLGNTTLVALDEYDDAQIVRAYQRESAVSGIVESQWDNPLFDYDWLYEHGLAGEKDAEGFFLFPVQSRFTALEGATWQNYTRLRVLEEAESVKDDYIQQLESRVATLEQMLPAGGR